LSFTEFNLHPSIMSGVQRQGYTKATPIQTQAIPPIMEGKDLIGIAQTGTGKTAAFVLPILQHLMKLPKGRIGALIVSPTRELAEQTCDAIDQLGRGTGLRAVAVYGGVSMEMQSRALHKGTEIVAACPGRLLDHLWRGSVDLSHVEILVIDEADRLFDMGFLPDIRSILKCLTRPRQTLLFSATMPADIRKLVQEVLTDPVTVQIGISAPANTVSHAIYPVEQQRKTPLLLELLKKTQTKSVLVFTRTKSRAERVTDQLEKAGYRVASLQGNLAQHRRQAAIDGFRDGKYKVLVATDIAARGIDVQHISHVINYDMPDTVDAYTHRIGRTGRIENTGIAFTFVTGEDSAMVRDIEKILKKPIERRTVEGFEISEEALQAAPKPRRFPPSRIMARARIASKPGQRPQSPTAGPRENGQPARPAGRGYFAARPAPKQPSMAH
jgi:ATP-dependent RNA helicase RhlE